MKGEVAISTAASNLQTVTLQPVATQDNKETRSTATFGDIGYISGVKDIYQRDFTIEKYWGEDTQDIPEELYIELWCWNDPGKESVYTADSTTSSMGENPRSGNLMYTTTLRAGDELTSDEKTALNTSPHANDYLWARHTWHNLDERVQFYIVEYYFDRDENGKYILDKNGNRKKVLIGTTMPAYAPIRVADDTRIFIDPTQVSATSPISSVDYTAWATGETKPLTYTVDYYYYATGEAGHSAGDPVSLTYNTDGVPEAPDMSGGDIKKLTWTMTIYVYDVNNDVVFKYDPYSSKPIDLQSGLSTDTLVKWGKDGGVYKPIATGTANSGTVTYTDFTGSATLYSESKEAANFNVLGNDTWRVSYGAFDKDAFGRMQDYLTAHKESLAVTDLEDTKAYLADADRSSYYFQREAWLKEELARYDGQISRLYDIDLKDAEKQQ